MPEPPARVETHLRQFELGDAELLHDFIPEDVGCSENPTSPAALLIGPRSGLEVNDVVEDVSVGDLGRTVKE